MRFIAVVVVVAACSKGKPDDCAIVRDKPESAMAELSSRYPNNPVKVAETIEKCVAPSGEECDRIAKIVTAIPSMAPQIAAPKQPFDYAKTCRESPPEFRKCLLPSYALAHVDDCRAAMQAAIPQLAIKPKGSNERVTDDDCAGFVSIYVDLKGIWLATGRDPKSRCFAPRKQAAPPGIGKLDADWLEAELRKVKASKCSPSSAELAAATDVPYSDVIALMDTSIKAGVVDVGLSDPASLSVPLASADPKSAASECPASIIHFDAKDHEAAAGTGVPPPGHSTDALKNAPVLIITKDKLSLSIAGTPTELGTVADAKAGTGNFAPLTKALPAAKHAMLILQADESTSATVINRVIATAKAAGYDNILFAVKNK